MDLRARTEVLSRRACGDAASGWHYTMREQVRAGWRGFAEKLQDESIQTGNWSAEASPQSAHAD